MPIIRFILFLFHFLIDCILLLCDAAVRARAAQVFQKQSKNTIAF
jgi:hypothetical protein